MFSLRDFDLAFIEGILVGVGASGLIWLIFG